MLRKCLGISHANAWKCLSIPKHFVAWNAQYACNTKHFPSILALKGVSASCICLENQAFSRHIPPQGASRQRHMLGRPSIFQAYLMQNQPHQQPYAWKTNHFPSILSCRSGFIQICWNMLGRPSIFQAYPFSHSKCLDAKHISSILCLNMPSISKHFQA